MSENPYQAPAPPNSQHGKWSAKSWITFSYSVLMVLAMVAGVATYLINTGPALWFIQPFFFAAPPIALLTFTLLRGWPMVTRPANRQSTFRGNLSTWLLASPALALAGYICFVPTCATGSIVFNTIEIHDNFRPTTSQAIAGALITTVCVIIPGLAIGAFLQRFHRKNP